jgi:hypothetical protein
LKKVVLTQFEQGANSICKTQNRTVLVTAGVMASSEMNA